MLNKLRDEIHANAVAHGWWQDERPFGEIIALCHSELSGALEEYRNGHKPTEIYYGDCDYSKCQLTFEECYRQLKTKSCNLIKPEGIPIELADCIIRILDYCGKEGIDIEEAIRSKHEYNKSRPYRHGNKVI